MGASSSSVEVPEGGKFGYHVLKVHEGSPGAAAGLEEYFDFIISIGNTRLNQNDETFKEILKASEDKTIKMTVYSSKTDRVRQVDIMPTSQWNGTGLLGVSIKFDSFENARKNVWHILNVEPNSPAEVAGLQSNCDYIIGTDSLLRDSEDLYGLIEAHEGKPLRLFVYNLLTDNVREVVITPNSRWGGEGCLGCGIGYGYLHRIPDQSHTASGRSEHTPLLNSIERNESAGDLPSISQIQQTMQHYQHYPQPVIGDDTRPLATMQGSNVLPPGSVPVPFSPSSSMPMYSSGGITATGGITTKLSLPETAYTAVAAAATYNNDRPLTSPNYGGYSSTNPVATVPTNTITTPITIPGLPSTNPGPFLPPEVDPNLKTATDQPPPPPPPNSLAADAFAMPRMEDLRISSTTQSQPVSNYPSYLNDMMSVPYSQPSQQYSSMVSSNFSQGDFSNTSSSYAGAAPPVYTSSTSSTIDFSRNPAI
ncbi:Golgi reassembly-stacking protein 2 isoform X2 [Brevipalpus obovatus]|uniref:Golgi reassembly-stacking protein 2 isoform X2 n=1 Tax=Brevipalpus obovatus TaxID=246614 RepID=UPI003D9F0C15